MSREIPRQHKILFHSQPANFLQIPNNAVSGALRNALYCGVVSVAVINGSRNAELLCAVVAHDAPYAKDVERLLGKLGFPVLYDDGASEYQIIQFLRECFKRESPTRRFAKKVIRLEERALITATKGSLGIWAHTAKQKVGFCRAVNEKSDLEEKKWGALARVVQARQKRRFKVYEEVALNEFLTIDPGDEVSREPNLREAVNKWRTYRCDVLVTAYPYWKPILILESDGGHHRWDDETYERDKNRDCILLLAGLAVLRIGSLEVIEDRYEEKLGGRTAKRPPRNFIPYVIRSICDVLSVNPDDTQKQMSLLKRLFRAAQKQAANSGCVLTETERSAILESALRIQDEESFGDAYMRHLNATSNSFEIALLEEVGGLSVTVLESQFDARNNWLRSRMEGHLPSGARVIHESQCYVDLRLPESMKTCTPDLNEFIAVAAKRALLSQVSDMCGYPVGGNFLDLSPL